MRDGMGPGTGLASIEEQMDLDVLWSIANKIYFRDAGISIHSNADGKLTITADGSGVDDITLSGTVTGDANWVNQGTFTVGVDDTGFDIKFFGATASSHLLWDESADTLKLVSSKIEVGSTSTLTGAVTCTAGVQSASVARTATSDGLTTAIIADGTTFVTVTSASANNIIVLPTPTPGNVVWLMNAGTGYELRSDTPVSVAINAGSGSNAESAVGANVLLRCVCTTVTTWVVSTFSTTGTEAALEAAG